MSPQLAAMVVHQWRRHRLVLVLVPLGLLLFEFLVTRIVPSPAQTAQLSAFLAVLPPQVLQVFGLKDAASVTARGVLGFGYVHPFVVLLVGLWTVRVAAGGLAGEIGGGTMDLIASRPITRTALVLGVAGVTATGIVLAAAGAFVGTALGLVTRDLGDVHLVEFVRVAAGLALLFAGWAGVTLLASAVYRHGGGAIALVSGAMAVTFAVDYLARAWQPLHALRPFSPFAYYDPPAILRSGFAPHTVEVLGGMAVVGLSGAVLLFRRRDL